MTPVPVAVRLDRAVLDGIERAAEAAWPREACGLLLGRTMGRPVVVEVTRAAPSENVAADPERSFEVAPALFARLAADPASGGARLVGLYHSHPDGPAAPSPRDRAAAWQDGWIWLITAVADGRAGTTAAHVAIGAAGEGRAFRPVPLEVVPR